MPTATDPKYVRLASRLSGGIVCDVFGSGWSIAGYDVRKFPEGNTAARYVRGQLNAGYLEPAGKAEWDEVHKNEVEEEMLNQRPDFKKEAATVQEAQIQRAAAAGLERIQSSRDADDDDEAEAEVEADRNERLAEGASQETDDPEEQISRSNPTRVTKASQKKGKSSKKKSSSDEA